MNWISWAAESLVWMVRHGLEAEGSEARYHWGCLGYGLQLGAGSLWSLQEEISDQWQHWGTERCAGLIGSVSVPTVPSTGRLSWKTERTVPRVCLPHPRILRFWFSQLWVSPPFFNHERLGWDLHKSQNHWGFSVLPMASPAWDMALLCI